MQTELHTIEEVYEEYAAESLRLAEAAGYPRVFKADVYNESADKEGLVPVVDKLALKCEAVTAVDIHRRRTDIAAERYAECDNVEVIHGDIRAIEMPDDHYGVILDLSTINHLPLADAEELLRKYRDWLTVDGYLWVVVWVSFTPVMRPKNASSDTHYAFPIDVFTRALFDAGFLVYARRDLFGPNTGPYLLSLICRKAEHYGKASLD